MPTEYNDSIFTKEMKRIKLAAKYPVNSKNKLPLKPMVDLSYKGRKVPLVVDVRVSLRDAAQQNHVLEITYKKTTTNEIKVYKIEPYSFRYLHLKVGIRKMVFGWDVKEKRIKSFALRNIMKAKITGSKFSPRFPVEIGKRIRKKSVRKLAR